MCLISYVIIAGIQVFNHLNAMNHKVSLYSSQAPQQVCIDEISCLPALPPTNGPMEQRTSGPTEQKMYQQTNGQTHPSRYGSSACIG